MKRQIVAVLVLLMVFSASFADGVTRYELSFKEASDLALKNSASIKVADLSIEAETLAVKEAEDAYKTAYRNKDFYTTYESKLVLNGYLKRIAEMQLNLATKGKTVSTRMVEFGVYNAYFGYALSKEQVELKSLNVNRIKEVSNTVQLKLKLGMATRNDAEAALVNLSAAENELKNAQLDMAIAKSKLNQALSLPLDAEVVLKDQLTENVEQPKAMDAAIESALINRIDVYGKTEAKAISDLGYEIAEKFYISKIVSTLKKAELDQLKGDNELLQAQLDARIAVMSAYNDVLKAQNSYQSLQNSLKVLQTSYATSKKMFELGMISQITLLEISDGLSEMEYQVRQMLLMKNMALMSYKLAYEVGGL